MLPDKVIKKKYKPIFWKNPEKYYDGKTLRIKGEIKEYEGQAEIILEDLSQIETGN